MTKTTVDQKTVATEDGQEIVVAIEASKSIRVTYQRVGVDETPLTMFALVTESGAKFDEDFPSDVSNAEQYAILKAVADMLLADFVGER